MQQIKRMIKSLVHGLGYDIHRLNPEQNPSLVVGQEASPCPPHGPLSGDGGQKPGGDPDESEYARLCEQYAIQLREIGVSRAHYGSGPRLLGQGWVNLDLRSVPPDSPEVHIRMDLASRHPFPSNFFQFAFAEDFIEHLDQVESVLFLAEVFRTLRPHGVCRLSFPGLPGVLRKHFSSTDWKDWCLGRYEAYTMWEHKHFYCEESLSLVAKHFGFSEVRFVEYGHSAHPELCNLDSRPDQIGLNIYVELTKG